MIKSNRAPRAFGIILKVLCFLIIISIISIFIWRSTSSKTPKSLALLSPNEKLITAYEQNNNKISPYTQGHFTITRDPKCYGYFSVTSAIFIPEANQLQLIMRYNNSTIAHLKEDFGVETLPDRKENIYDVSLVIRRFADSSKSEDNLTTERIHPTSVETAEKSIYNFRKFIFDGVNIDDMTCSAFLDIYYAEKIDYNSHAYGTLLIYDYITENEEYKLSGKEKAFLENKE